MGVVKSDKYELQYSQHYLINSIETLLVGL